MVGVLFLWNLQVSSLQLYQLIPNTKLNLNFGIISMHHHPYHLSRDRFHWHWIFFSMVCAYVHWSYSFWGGGSQVLTRFSFWIKSGEEVVWIFYFLFFERKGCVDFRKGKNKKVQRIFCIYLILALSFSLLSPPKLTHKSS